MPPEIVEIASPLRAVGKVTLDANGGSTPGFAPPNSRQRWVVGEVMVSLESVPGVGQASIAVVNGPFISTGVTTGGVTGATQPLSMELFLNHQSSSGNSLGSTLTGVFTQRKIHIHGTERLVVVLSSDSHYAGIVATVIVTGTRYQRRR